MRRRGLARRLVAVLATAGVLAVMPVGPAGGSSAAGSRGAVRLAVDEPLATSPIQHVVIIDQENHSFDNVLGALCASGGRCDGATTGVTAEGETIPLRRAPDVVPWVAHGPAAQGKSVDGGIMDGYSTIGGCTSADGFACYTQYAPQQIPNLAALARTFALSDRTFESDLTSSWGSHLELVAATLNGFDGSDPTEGTSGRTGPGWGCDSFDDATWNPPDGGVPVRVPSCVPFADGSGPYPTVSPQTQSELTDPISARTVSRATRFAWMSLTTPTFTLRPPARRGS